MTVFRQLPPSIYLVVFQDSQQILPVYYLSIDTHYR
jgi:hypothetical protein